MGNEPNILVASARRCRAMALGEKAVNKLVKRSVVETARTSSTYVSRYLALFSTVKRCATFSFRRATSLR
jgi:hypothetical protein